jgi:hypothetical protein
MTQQDAESMDVSILHLPGVLSLVGVKVSVYEQKGPARTDWGALSSSSELESCFLI